MKGFTVGVKCTGASTHFLMFGLGLSTASFRLIVFPFVLDYKRMA